MKNLNKILTTTIIGGLLVGSCSYVDKTNHEINALEEKLTQKSQELSGLEDLISRKDIRIAELTKKMADEKIAFEKKLAELESRKVHFNKSDVTQPSNLTSKRLEKVFNSSNTYKGLRGLESAFIDAERECGVNAVFLMSLVSQESGFGRSRRAVEDFNMGGVAVYSSTSKGRSYSSKYESIMSIGKLLHDRYIGRGLTTIYSIGSVYCPNDPWADPILSIANSYMEKLN